jgi:hypothetical protein
MSDQQGNPKPQRRKTAVRYCELGLMRKYKVKQTTD